MLYLNEFDELTEGSRTNIFARLRGERFVTPPLSAGVLDGCLRHEMIEKGDYAKKRR